MITFHVNGTRHASPCPFATAAGCHPAILGYTCSLHVSAARPVTGTEKPISGGVSP